MSNNFYFMSIECLNYSLTAAQERDAHQGTTPSCSATASAGPAPSPQVHSPSSADSLPPAPFRASPRPPREPLFLPGSDDEKDLPPSHPQSSLAPQSSGVMLRITRERLLGLNFKGKARASSDVDPEDDGSGEGKEEGGGENEEDDDNEEEDNDNDNEEEGDDDDDDNEEEEEGDGDGEEEQDQLDEDDMVVDVPGVRSPRLFFFLFSLHFQAPSRLAQRKKTFPACRRNAGSGRREGCRADSRSFQQTKAQALVSSSSSWFKAQSRLAATISSHRRGHLGLQSYRRIGRSAGFLGLPAGLRYNGAFLSLNLLQNSRKALVPCLPPKAG